MALKFQGGKAVDGKKPTPNDSIRRAYYTMSDGRHALEPALSELGDQEVLAKFRAVKQAIDEFERTLSRKYRWD